jgi:hypothetical protein
MSKQKMTTCKTPPTEGDTMLYHDTSDIDLDTLTIDDTDGISYWTKDGNIVPTYAEYPICGGVWLTPRGRDKVQVKGHCDSPYRHALKKATELIKLTNKGTI